MAAYLGSHEKFRSLYTIPSSTGNKRTGFAATYNFVAINDARIAADATAAYVFIAGLYETNDFTFEKLAAWLRDNVEPASP